VERCHPFRTTKGDFMGELWIRTISNGLIRADRVTEISSTRGSLQEDQGYSLKVIVDGKAHVVIDDSELQGSLAERLEYARHVEDALLLAMDEAKGSEVAMVVCYEHENERWSLAAAAELAGALPVHAPPREMTGAS
jgi:hypothetical protein